MSPLLRRPAWLRRAALWAAAALFWTLPDTSFSGGEPTVEEKADALAVADLDRDLKAGYSLRQDTWGGELPAGVPRRIQHQLFKDNEYRFCAWTATKGATVSLHVCDADDHPVESRCWQKTDRGLSVAGADIRPTATGSYYLIVRIEQSPAERTPWTMVYAYK